jgi:mono/diheme cytochrome c family protein
MMKNGIFLSALVFSCALFLSAQPTEAADSAKGQEVYNTYCALCHGPTGLGDGVGAAALDPKPRDLSSAAILETYTDEFLVNVITNGGMAVGKSPAMPPWGGIVTPEDIENVVAHIRQNLCKCEYKK